jgi:NAD(P)-dependent dehydrogenase (short-subunit alcohol dehydrogenase family)
MLKGRTALITGGASGIGLAAAHLMHTNGARVVLTGRDASKLEVARQEIGEDVLALQVDVLSRKSLVTMASKIKEAFGGLGVFFANAGVAYVTPLATTTEDAYDTLIDTNVKSVFFSLQALEPILREGASVILNTAWLKPGGRSWSRGSVRHQGSRALVCTYVLGRAVGTADPRQCGEPRPDRHTDPARRWTIRASGSD